MHADSIGYASHLASHSDNPNHLSHIWEFRELATRVAIEQIYELVPPLVADICKNTIRDAFNGAMDSIQYDIKSIADISIKDFNEQFHSEKFSRFISGAVANEIRKRIDEIEILI